MISPTGAAASNAQQSSPQPPPSGQVPKTPQFPPHNAPRVWLLTNGASPISTNLARHLLAHGDYIVLCVPPKELQQDEQRSGEFDAFLQDIKRQTAGRKQTPLTENVDTIEDLGSNDDGPGGNGIGNSNGQDVDDEEASDADRPASNTKPATKMKPWRERIRIVPVDSDSTSQAQAAVAEALTSFRSGIDILLLSTPSFIIGTVEELGQSPAASALVREQFDKNFFVNVALIKAVLPIMREHRNGHIMLLTGISGHLGTPGFATYCASQWAMEGYCDSLAYEIAPFNVRMTIVQPNVEVNVLTNRIVSVPPMDAYAPDVNPAPLAREIFSRLLDKIEGVTPMDEMSPQNTSHTSGSSYLSPTAEQPAETPASLETDGSVLTTGDMLSASTSSSVYAPLAPAIQSNLVAETVFAIAAIGGHDNPPARHIVGFEGVTSVREKLKTVSEELEDFIEVSNAVDFAKDEGEG